MAHRPVVIVAAVNGGMQENRDGAIVPCTPEEIAEAAYRCHQEGATVVHVHARDEHRRNSGDPKIYSEIIRRVRDRCDILIQTTNGIGVRRDAKTGQFVWPTDEERLQLLRLEPRQDLFGIAAGSMDFYHPEGGYRQETPYVNSIELLRTTIEAVYALGSALEYEVVEASALHRLLRLADQGVFDRHRENVWLLHGGGFGATPPVARNILFSIDEGQRLFPRAKWGVVGTGRDQGWIGALGLSLGCDTVRVGFEDSIHLPNGEVAQHNHQQVREMVKIARTFGREPASVAEARRVFGLA